MDKVLVPNLSIIRRFHCIQRSDFYSTRMLFKKVQPLKNGQSARPKLVHYSEVPLYTKICFCSTRMLFKKVQPLKNGQSARPKLVHYSEVPLYTKIRFLLYQNALYREWDDVKLITHSFTHTKSTTKQRVTTNQHV